MHRFTPLGALAAALALPACTSYAPPQLTLTQASIVEETPEGILIRFKMDALNPNSIELPLREVRYTLSIDGTLVFSGVRSPEATLRRLGTQSFEFPASVARDPAHPLPTGKARYDLEGRLTYLTPGQLAE